jgi:hypothetical protein
MWRPCRTRPKTLRGLPLYALTLPVLQNACLWAPWPLEFSVRRVYISWVLYFSVRVIVDAVILYLGCLLSIHTFLFQLADEQNMQMAVCLQSQHPILFSLNFMRTFTFPHDAMQSATQWCVHDLVCDKVVVVRQAHLLGCYPL